MYDSSHHSMILTSTSIHIHPYALHPYPLDIAFLASCSNLASSSLLYQSASHAWAMGNCGTCCIGRGKEVGMADDGRCVVHLCWDELTTTWDRGLRYKPSFFQQHQMIFEKCLKLVGRKWFPFRRFLMAGRSTFLSQTNAPLHSVFSCIDKILSHFHVWRHAKQTQHYILSVLSFFISFLSSSYVGHYTSLIKPFLVCPLVKREVFQFDRSNYWTMSKTCAQDASPSSLSPKASQLGTKGVFEDRDFQVQCMRCRMDLNAFPAAQQKFAGFHLCTLMNFVHSSNWVDLWDNIRSK